MPALSYGILRRRVLTRRLSILYPVLLAVYPVLYLWSQNVRHTLVDDVVPSLVVALFVGVVSLVLASLALRDGDSGAVVGASVVIAGAFLFPSVMKLIGGLVNIMPAERDTLLSARGSGVVFLMVAAIGIAAATVLAVSPRFRPHMPSFNSAASVGVLVLIAFPMATLASYYLSTPAFARGGASGITATRVPHRDIYYLILDRYGSSDALRDAFNVTSNDLPDWLAAQGFYVASGARANFDSTRLSIASTLNLDFLEGVAALAGKSSTNFTPIHELIQDHKVGRFLQEQGYEYVHIGNWYAPTSHVRIATKNVALGGGSEFSAKLYEETALPGFEGLINGETPAPAAEKLQFETGRFQFATLLALADQPGPKFVVAHILLPHEPYVFAADGTYVGPDEREGLTIDARFQAQLAYTNSAVKALVQRLFSRPDAERPIVVIQADEGPYPADAPSSYVGWADATGAQLRTKYGILDALYLPDDGNATSSGVEPYPTITSVNTFRLVFDRYFGTDLPMLPDHSFAARSPATPYDLIDVTDRLQP